MVIHKTYYVCDLHRVGDTIIMNHTGGRYEQQRNVTHKAYWGDDSYDNQIKNVIALPIGQIRQSEGEALRYPGGLT